MKKNMATLIVFITLVSAILSWPLIKNTHAYNTITCYIQSEYEGYWNQKVCVYNCAGEQVEMAIADAYQCPMRIKR